MYALQTGITTLGGPVYSTQAAAVLLNAMAMVAGCVRLCCHIQTATLAGDGMQEFPLHQQLEG
jgi:hypothetical protein